jgi:hypothetical protein
MDIQGMYRQANKQSGTKAEASLTSYVLAVAVMLLCSLTEKAPLNKRYIQTR